MLLILNCHTSTSFLGDYYDAAVDGPPPQKKKRRNAAIDDKGMNI